MVRVTLEGVSPSDAVADSELQEAADAASNHAAAEGGEAVDASDMGGGSSGRSLGDALMSTEPDLSPETTLGDAPDVVTHAYIGVRKVMASFGVADGADADGTPAIMNFALAGWGWFSATVEDGDGGEEVEDDGADALGLAEDELDDPAAPGGPPA